MYACQEPYTHRAEKFIIHTWDLQLFITVTEYGFMDCFGELISFTVYIQTPMAMPLVLLSCESHFFNISKPNNMKLITIK